MTITLHWWIFVIVLIVAPIILGTFSKSKGDYDFDFVGVLFLVSCWALAIGLSIGFVCAKYL